MLGIPSIPSIYAKDSNFFPIRPPPGLLPVLCSSRAGTDLGRMSEVESDASSG